MRVDGLAPGTCAAPRALLTAWVLLLAGPAMAAERCNVPAMDADAPDGFAQFLRYGPQGMPAPRVVVRTVERHANSSAIATPPSGGAGARGAPKPAPPRPRPVPANDQERLMEAIFTGDAASVERLVRSPGVDLNAAPAGHVLWRPIEVAAMRCQPAVVRTLLAHGARVQGAPQPVWLALNNLASLLNPDIPSSWAPERTPHDYEVCIGLLLDAGADADAAADPTHPDSALGQLVRMRAFDGDARIARALIAHGARLGADAPGGSPLALAIERNRRDLAEAMLEGRPDPRALDAALGPAFGAHDLELARRLLEAGASPRATLYGQPVLCAALRADDPGHALARTLVERGAALDVECAGGPPVTLASGDRDLVLLMLAHGADPNHPNHAGATVLDLTPDADHALADAILARGGHIGLSLEERSALQQQPFGNPGPVLRTMLHGQDYVAMRLLRRDGLGGDSTCAAVLYAASTGSAATLSELLRRGGDPNSVTERGSTALMVAAARGQSGTLGVLLGQRRTKVDATTPRVFHVPPLYSESSPPLWTGGRTALMYAALGGHAESVQLLLQHGADPGRKDAEGYTAGWYARTPETRALLGP